MNFLPDYPDAKPLVSYAVWASIPFCSDFMDHLARINQMSSSFVRSVMERWCWFVCLLACCSSLGCGNSLQIEGTQQLLASDAIDKSVAKIDFSPLQGQIVYFDPQYIKMEKGIGFVNANYIVSAIRQQLFAHGCRLVESKEDARFIVEARVGALGGNQHDVIYGVPENNALTKVATMMPNTPSIPSIPELSVARRSLLSASAKVAVFAYEKESGDSIWQSGTSVAESDARHTWLFGAGPFQKGSIYTGTNLAGEKLRLPFLKKRKSDEEILSAFHDPQIYRDLPDSSEGAEQKEETVVVEEDEVTANQEPKVLPANFESEELIPAQEAAQKTEPAETSDESLPEWARQ